MTSRALRISSRYVSGLKSVRISGGARGDSSGQDQMSDVSGTIDVTLIYADKDILILIRNLI